MTRRRYRYARGVGLGRVRAACFAVDLGFSQDMAEAADWIRS